MDPGYSLIQNRPRHHPDRGGLIPGTKAPGPAGRHGFLGQSYTGCGYFLEAYSSKKGTDNILLLQDILCHHLISRLLRNKH